MALRGLLLGRFDDDHLYRRSCHSRRLLTFLSHLIRRSSKSWTAVGAKTTGTHPKFRGFRTVSRCNVVYFLQFLVGCLASLSRV